MSLYVIADLHLSGAVHKPMDIFGSRWTEHTAKIEKYWRAVVNEEDTVIIPGDVSWGISLEEALPDMKLIASLPGKKIIGKGNHDYWWATAAKMKEFFAENSLTGFEFLYNNAHITDEFIIAGTRGWYSEDRQDAAPDTADYKKIVAREAMRLRASLEAAKELSASALELETLVFFHFPPVFRDFVCRELVDILHEYGIRRAYFGHIHGTYDFPRSFEFEGISFALCSADFLSFIPMAIYPEAPERVPF